MAKNYNEIQGVIQIFKKTYNLLRRSNKIFFFVVLVSMIPYTLLFLANIFSLTSVVQDLWLTTQSIMYRDYMDYEDVELLRQTFNLQVKTFLIILAQILCFHLMAIVSLLLLVSTVNVSDVSYLEKDSKLKELSLKIKRIWVRPMITWFYVNLFFTAIVLLILLDNFSYIISRGFGGMFTVATILLFLFSILNFYLALVWNVGLVISVLEDVCELQVFGDGNGKKLVGFILMLIFGVPFTAWQTLTDGKLDISSILPIILLALSFVFVVIILSLTTDTAYYSESKQVVLQPEMVYDDISVNLLQV